MALRAVALRRAWLCSFASRSLARGCLFSRRVERQNFVQRTLPVTFQIERNVLKPEPPENRRQLPRHVRIQGPRQLLRSDLDSHQFSVKSRAKLTERERLNLFLAPLHRLDVLDRHRRSIRNPGTQARGGRPVPRGQSRQPGKLPNLRLAQVRLHQRGLYL